MQSHHPGPPRFTTVGEAVELAPRNPGQDATFSWTARERPADSTVTVGNGPVVHFAPDEPGVYSLELSAPDSTHVQTVRAFPDPRRTARFELPVSELPVPEADVSEISVVGPFNDYTLGRKRAIREGDNYVAEFELPPDDHDSIFVVNNDFELSVTVGATVEGPGRPRVHLDSRVEGDEVVVTAEAKAAPDGSSPEVEFYLDDRDGLTEDDVRIGEDELRVDVDRLHESARIHAVAVAERHSVADTLVLGVEDGAVSGVRNGNLSEAEAEGTVEAARPNDPPEWAQDAVMYEIFVRSFADEAVATTFEEIERRVEYLESLGINCVWLTPVLESPTEHGYHITDYFDTATDLGSRAEFESLVERLHDSGIRVVFDLVINHTSRDHPAFQMHSAGVEKYADQYERVPAEADTSDVDWASLSSGYDTDASPGNAPGYYFNWTRIPNVNYDSLAVRRWMLDVVEEWASVVDGFRCDVAWGVPHGFWKEVRERVRAEDGEFLLMDETIPRNPDYHENEFDVHYDTAMYGTLREIGAGDAPADDVFDALEDTRWRGFPDAALHMRYVENHDEDRYLAECDVSALRAAATVTFALPGVPMIYYGQERGVEEMRGTMRWHDGDADLTEFHRALVRVREEHPALSTGRVERVAYDIGEEGVTADGEDVTAFARVSADESERLVVAVNFGEEARTMTFEDERATDADGSASDATVGATDLISGRNVSAGDEDERGRRVRVEDAVVLRG